MSAGARVTRAVVRPVSPSLADCELTFLARGAIDVARAGEQHAAYCRALETCGAALVWMEAAPDLPDAVFVEDSAVALDGAIVITRPGAESRRGETLTAASALAPFGPLSFIREPGTIDGGDVLRVGRDLFVGVTARTNRDGFEQLETTAQRLGYRAIAVPVHGCLHLKTAVTAIDDETLILKPEHVARDAFAGYALVEADASEVEGANVVPVNGCVFVAASAPRTRDLVARRGYEVVSLDVSEFEKAEAGLSCLSILL